MNRKQQMQIASQVDSLPELIGSLAKVARKSFLGKRGTWAWAAGKLLSWIESGFESDCPFSVFIKNGNKKLPFYAFSSLPFVDCPGKGQCVNYCYSLRAWRYPAAFFRQVQNSLLMRYCPEKIAKAFQAIPTGKTLRLFVDGDFKDVATLKFFMDLINSRPDLSVYGYSKSWKEFVQLDSTGYAWPKNYRVRKSNGSKWARTGISNAFSRLPIVGGEFDAVPVAREFIRNRSYQDTAMPGSREYRATVRKELSKTYSKVFPCPGNCGNCLPGGRHACGVKEFDGIAIGIGIHN